MVTSLGIKCGKCKQYHATVEEVKACNLLPWEERPPSDKQMNYLYVLADKHPESELQPNDCTTSKQASEMIGKFELLEPAKVAKPFATPRFTTPAPAYVPPPAPVPYVRYEYWKETADTVGIPKGRYAVDIDGVTRFYRWKNGTGTNKDNWYLTDQRGSKFIPVTDKKMRTRIWAAIMIQGINESRKRYGHLLKHCGYCGAPLTNDVSRAYGIGPDCRERYGL